jgi:hypothetical protein
MLNMNLKLQNSASKMQARALDLELAKIEAKVYREHVEIVKVSTKLSMAGLDANGVYVLGIPAASLF